MSAALISEARRAAALAEGAKIRAEQALIRATDDAHYARRAYEITLNRLRAFEDAAKKETHA